MGIKWEMKRYEVWDNDFLTSFMWQYHTFPFLRQTSCYLKKGRRGAYLKDFRIFKREEIHSRIHEIRHESKKNLPARISARAAFLLRARIFFCAHIFCAHVLRVRILLRAREWRHPGTLWKLSLPKRFLRVRGSPNVSTGSIVSEKVSTGSGIEKRFLRVRGAKCFYGSKMLPVETFCTF